LAQSQGFHQSSTEGSIKHICSCLYPYEEIAEPKVSAELMNKSNVEDKIIK
jgi:hypothetical protein